MSGNFWKGIINGLLIEAVIVALILWLLIGCTTTPVGVEFSREQCLLLQQRGENTTKLCRRLEAAAVAEEAAARASPDAGPA